MTRKSEDIFEGKSAPNLMKFLVVFCCLFPADVIALWWAVGGQLVLDPKTMCQKSRGLGGRQREICRNHQLVEEIVDGVKMAMDECQFQFQMRRWNCTSDRKIMKRLLEKSTRESAFLWALTSAGVLHRIADSCSKGHLVDCSCSRGGNTEGRTDQAIRSPVHGGGSGGGRSVRKRNEEQGEGQEGGQGEGGEEGRTEANGGVQRSASGVAGEGEESSWTWLECSDYFDYSYSTSKQFVDLDRKSAGSDFIVSVRLHNNEIGRQCHGLSGSCTTTTCWRKLPEFSAVAERLRDAYDDADLQEIPNRGGSEVVTSGPGHLVYIQGSPDFCVRNRKEGSLGTRGRVCNVRSELSDGCDVMCCGRGFRTHLVTVVENCRCSFRYCCEVVCQTCRRKVKVHRCR